MAVTTSASEDARSTSVLPAQVRCSNATAPTSAHPVNSGRNAQGYTAPKASAPHAVSTTVATTRQDVWGFGELDTYATRDRKMISVRDRLRRSRIRSEGGNDMYQLVECAGHVAGCGQAFEFLELNR